MQEAEQRRLESAKARALQEAEEIMERLVDVIPQLNAGLSPKELLEQEYMQNMPEKRRKKQPDYFRMSMTFLQERSRNYPKRITALIR